MDVRKTVRVEICTGRFYEVLNVGSNISWSKDRRVAVHIQAEEEMRNQAELHNHSGFAG